ncbi:Golgi transport complex subunit 4 [Ophidiomyces ophidiicola]|uniref:Golgi transport complex subunit 4 n=1 Tax=Ophidiomyces ophidiicola TaxID=1387563 RepID=A0ACB8V2E9_9EURO|nr:Golgi transport complex subunit 4 [Ophidiomyces ophidiicola]KAI1921035.1 Golgi transport complex subunit 4 [Ophidiomyces ophidiicola]KAI1929448.1 Golgi transport complex subunit 4 [Ophidiomyces ophidiicola]KAI1954513.1 Golgi transport complex subunit 4 [Ophidiomyces ophidiicola]KAI1961799.1 Golgi transport complex subunit 4 [Ophidiomyces ophidiicola]
MSKEHSAANGNVQSENIGPEPEPNIFNATSVSEIRATLSALHDREASVTASLDSLVASQKDFSRELGRLDLLRAHIGSQASTTRTISHGMLSDTAAMAQRLSSAVERLDMEQSRVKATLEMVEQVAELKACVLGVAGSMGASQDWEMAASYMNRASKVPPEIVKSTFAADIVPTTEVPDPPAVTLENAAESLCGLFLREFDRAVKENDGAKITRFFKLFPLIDRSDVGLDVYGRYVCQGVASRARASLNAGTGGNESKEGFFYANVLTKLFEHIAQIVEGHGGLVERHYGTGKMARVVEKLQVEADVQGGIILETWSDERTIDRKLSDIKSYAFTFLVQSFLPNSRAGSIQRTNSPGIRDTASQRTSEDDSVDMKEIDGILNEICLMLGRWSLYCRFLADKCRTDRSEDFLLPTFVVESPLAQKISERLTLPFNSMTTFFLRRSVEKAFQIEEAPQDLSLNLQQPPKSNPPHITSAVDDIMYIVKKVLEQTLSTGQKTVAMNVVPTVARILGSDFMDMILRKMRDETYPKPVVPGGLPPETAIVSFLILINNLEIAVSYVQRIVENITESSDARSTTPGEPENRIHTLFPLKDDAEAVLKALQSLCSSFESKAQDLIGDGVQVVFNNVVKNRLRPILTEAFRDIDYQPPNLDNGIANELNHEDVEYREFDGTTHQSLARHQFASLWRKLLVPISRVLNGRSFDRLLGVTLASFARLLEKRIWSYHGRVNDLGASRLESDITGIISEAIDVGVHDENGNVGNRYRYRELFARCTQIVMVMNLEDEEWEELEKSGGDVVDKLSPEERTRARVMTV